MVGICSQGNVNLDSGISESVCYTCTLDKAYRFFQDGHVQNVRVPSHAKSTTMFALVQLSYRQ